ncbi:MAG: hypothetical protein JWQ35_1068 [Bacteriovoracaceae bacterium]|nr:hypothetical protein [Bacteriovoracaceae bacterium]
MKFVLFIMLVLLSSCAPKLYVIDRQTVIETEATGDFPNLQKSFEKRAENFGPKMVDRSRLKQKEVPQRAYNILNGELTSETAKK